MVPSVSRKRTPWTSDRELPVGAAIQGFLDRGARTGERHLGDGDRAGTSRSSSAGSDGSPSEGMTDGSADGVVAGSLGDGASDDGAPPLVPQATRTIARIESAMKDRIGCVMAWLSRYGRLMVGRDLDASSVVEGRAIGHLSRVVLGHWAGEAGGDTTRHRVARLRLPVINGDRGRPRPPAIV